jgi:ABC-type transport system involved in multi-copper enzyme maturation permease subunit
MRSIFFKELRQGRPLLLFGLALGLLMPVLYVLSLRISRPVSPGEVDDLRSKLAFALLWLPPIIALFGGAGLFAAEADRGTLPLLFSLPVSRLRIWLAKILGGLTLTALASALLLVVANLLLPNPRGEPSIVASAYLPDMFLWTLFAFAVAAFASALASHTIAATLLGALLAGGLGALAIVMTQLGALLLGYDRISPIMDIGIWAAVIAVPLLLASAVVISRGELLRSARKFLLGIPAFAIALALIGSLLIGFVRFATRYQRHDVESVSLSAAGQAEVLRSPITLITYADPARYLRVSHSDGRWRRTSAGHDPDDRSWPAYRSVYSVLLDPETGRELDVLRLPGDASWCTTAVSPDGGRAAVAYRPAGLTWGMQQLHHQPQTLRIVELNRGNILYQAPPPNLTSNRHAGLRDLRWSPTGSYLAYALPPKVGERASCLHIVNADGSQPRVLPGDAADWAWSPTEDALYVLSRDWTVKRFRPKSTSNETIWSPGPDDPHTRRTLPVSGISPDGRWLVLTEEQVATVETRTGTAVALKRFGLRAISADGKHAQVIWSGEGPRRSTAPLAWSADGAALYFVVWRDHPSRARLLRWRPGDAQTETFIAELPFNLVWLLPVPDSDGVLVWGQLRDAWPNASQVHGAEAFILDGLGHRKALPGQAATPDFARANSPRGFDSAGRLIYRPKDHSTVNALDIATGKVRQIYP